MNQAHRSMQGGLLGAQTAPACWQCCHRASNATNVRCQAAQSSNSTSPARIARQMQQVHQGTALRDPAEWPAERSYSSVPAGSTVTAAENTVTDSRELAVALAKLGDDLKAKDVMVLHVEPHVSWTSYMVFITCTSAPQIGAVLTKLEQEAEERFERQRLAQRPGRGSWEVLDFGDVVVNVMTPASRQYYAVEDFYGQAEEVDLPFVSEATSEEDLQLSSGWSRGV